MPRPEYTPDQVHSYPYRTVSATTGRTVRRTATLTDARDALHRYHPEGGTFTVLDHADEIAATLIMADHRTPEQRAAGGSDDLEPDAFGY